MLKHAAILAVATASGLTAAQGLLNFATPRAAAEPRVAEASAEGQAAQVSKGADGHYWAQANVNGRWIKFLVDTGASSVALTTEDARRLGIDVAVLDYERPVITANGATKAAPVRLDRVSIAGATVEDVEAMVVRDGLPTSLLGMSYLGRLSRFEATPTTLILRP
jgi:aspartyl protease family protein